MRKALIPLLVVVAVAVYAGWHYSQGDSAADELKLYGNVDIRQVSLAFTLSERVESVLVEEGESVEAGQIVARLDRQHLELQLARVKASMEAQRQQVEKLKNCSRPEEIAQAQARYQGAQAELELAQNQLKRLQEVKRLTDGQGVSAQDLDNAQARLRAARAQVDGRAESLQLVRKGPRDEDVAAAQAQLATLQADQALLEHQLRQSELVAPMAARVRARLLEPGDIASPQRPVLTLALNDPKWVRVYVSEPDLGYLKPGMEVAVYTDTFPDQPIAGQIGYISSVAEFTPKNVQTESLRTALVYEVRVRVTDSENRLRLGMPATVRVALEPDQQRARAGT